MSKVYAVRKGRQTGLFYSWEECCASVRGYSCCDYRSFNSEVEAKRYLGMLSDSTVHTLDSVLSTSSTPIKKVHSGDLVQSVPSNNEFNLDENEAIVFTDGAFSPKEGYYSYGFVLFTRDKQYTMSACDNCKPYIESKNVAGEIFGAIQAINLALRLGISSLTICHDYKGVSAWAEGDWSARCVVSRVYANYLMKLPENFNLGFRHIKSHSGDVYNNLADKLASQAIRNRAYFSSSDALKSRV